MSDRRFGDHGIRRIITLYEFQDGTWDAADHLLRPHPGESGNPTCISSGDRDDVYEFVNQALFPHRDSG